jgi:hypothetical protein
LHFELLGFGVRGLLLRSCMMQMRVWIRQMQGVYARDHDGMMIWCLLMNEPFSPNSSTR